MVECPSSYRKPKEIISHLLTNTGFYLIGGSPQTEHDTLPLWLFMSKHHGLECGMYWATLWDATERHWVQQTCVPPCDRNNGLGCVLKNACLCLRRQQSRKETLPSSRGLVIVTQQQAFPGW